MHSENRRGKRVKTARSLPTKRKSTNSLALLAEKYHYAKKAEGIADSTLWRYQNAFNLLTEYLGSDDITLLNVDSCRDFATWLLNDRVRFAGHKYKTDKEKTKGLSPRTTNDVIKLLRTAFRFFESEQLVSENPFLEVKSIKQQEKVIDVLTAEELKELLNVPDQREYASFRDYVLMHVLTDTMARIQETLAIKVSYIDLNARLINLPPEVTKTRKGRFLYITKLTARLLKELIAEVAEFESEYVFLANYGEPLTQNHFRHRLANYVKETSIKKRVHPHLFRHTAATLFLEAGGDIRHLQVILGHSDLRMTMKYTHLSRKAVTIQHDQFSALNLVTDKLNKPRKIKR